MVVVLPQLSVSSEIGHGRRKSTEAVGVKTETKSKSALHVVHEGGDGTVRVEHYRLNRVGHEWPETINGVSTHRVIWSFLKRFSKP